MSFHANALQSECASVCVYQCACVCVSPDTSLMQMCAPIVAKWKSETEPSLSRGDQPANNRKKYIILW